MAYRYFQKSNGKERWRVQIDRQGVKVTKSFDTQLLALTYEEALKKKLKDGTYSDEDTVLDLIPTVTTFLSDYYNFIVSRRKTNPDETNDKYNKASHKTRLLKLIPSVKLVFNDMAMFHYDLKVFGDQQINENEPEKTPIAFGDLYIHSVNKYVVLKYIESRREAGLKDSTIGRELSYISSAFQNVENLCPHLKMEIPNPVRKLTKTERPFAAAPRKQLFNPNLVPLITEEFANKQNKSFLIVWLLCMEVGLRRSEAIGLKVENIDFKKGTAFLEVTKNRRSKTVPVPEYILNVITQFIEKQGVKTGKIFTLTHGSFQNCWYSVLDTPAFLGPKSA